MPRGRGRLLHDRLLAGTVGDEQTECSAWLLEFKNRTADFAAERDRAEKRMMRELNANPNSVTELKKIWGYEKGTVRAAQSDHPDNTAGA